jgi:hypothetical protein
MPSLRRKTLLIGFNKMSNEPTPSAPRKRGQHKDGCACNVCANKRIHTERAAKKNELPSEPPPQLPAPTPAIVKSEPPKNGSGAGSNTSSNPNSAPRAMAEKISRMEKTNKPPTNETPKPVQNPEPEKKGNWFERLFAGKWTLLAD